MEGNLEFIQWPASHELHNSQCTNNSLWAHRGAVRLVESCQEQVPGYINNSSLSVYSYNSAGRKLEQSKRTMKIKARLRIAPICAELRSVSR